MDRSVFEDLVREAVNSLPKRLLAHLNNVDLVVEDWPNLTVLDKMGLTSQDTLFGLYEGVPLTDRESYNMVLPDKITLFRGPIEADCRTPAEVRYQVQVTVAHEIAHHFGIGDKQLDDLGLG